MSLCYTSVHQNRLNSETAFAKQNEGLFAGEALLRDLGALLLALWGSDTRLEYSLQTHIAIEVFAAITILVFSV